MADAENPHPTAGRRRRDKGPPSAVPIAPEALPRLERVNDTESERSDDSAGEKEAKRQRSEPTTPVSTSSRLPYEYDALMGITRVGTKEAEGFDEELGTPEYHDASEEPTKREGMGDVQQEPRSTGFQGGYGSSSLKECIDLLNAKPRNTPAPLDSGVDQDSVSPPHGGHQPCYLLVQKATRQAGFHPFEAGAAAVEAAAPAWTVDLLHSRRDPLELCPLEGS